MGFQVSPGVEVKEIDLTGIIPTLSTSAGACVGQFTWGPVNYRTLIDQETKLYNTFGKPETNTYVSFFTAANFLAYGNNLRVVRVANSASNNAVSGGNTNALLIANEQIYEQTYYTGAGTFGEFAARYPGAKGNSLKVSVCGSRTAYASNASAQAVALGGSLNTANHVIGDAKTGNTKIFLNGSANTHVKAGDWIHFGNTSRGTKYKVTFANLTMYAFTPALTANVAANTVIQRQWEYYDQFDGAPGTSSYVLNKFGKNDELHLIVVDENGLFTGVPGTVLEKYSHVSKASDNKDDTGTSQYYPKVLFEQSKYIYWGDHDTNGTNWGSEALNTTFTDVSLPRRLSLNGGTDQVVTAGALQLGWDLFANADVVDASLLLAGDADLTLSNYIIQSVAEVRKDAVAFVSPPRSVCVNNIGSEADDVVLYRNGTVDENGDVVTAGLTSSSYGFMDSGWKYQYDKYNDTYRFLPLNGDMAGLCARTDKTRDPWFSPGGFNRGQIKNVVRMSWNPGQTERDVLYTSGVNPVVSFPGEGTILYGDKTLQTKPSAFDRINVRRLFIILEKAIARAAKYSLFEFNDEFTRAQFVSMVDPFLRDIQGRRGIFDYRVVCDTTNNTGEVIDSNRFIGDIYIKPARSINFILLNFVAVRTGVSFDEVVGKF